ncbi:hypothetical protein LC609_09640 [Nostoc sp. XA013]|nr:hypothetical protein [Nostoc sp. XA013]
MVFIIRLFTFRVKKKISQSQVRSPHLVGCVTLALTHHPKLATAIYPFFGQPIRERLFSATAIAL